MIVAPNATDISTYWKLVDPSTGTPKVGLTITDLDATYVRDRAAAVKADLTALSAVTDAHSDNKAIEVDATNAPGLYRVDFPDAAFASGVARVQLIVNGAAIDPAVIEVELMPTWAVAGDQMTLASGAITAAVVATGAIDSDALAVSAVNDIADRVWDEPLVAHLGVGSTGEALDAAAAGGAGLTAAQVWSYASRTLTTWPAGITYTGPVAEGGDVVTYRGDTYLNEDGRALEWESDDWPDLSGASIAVIIDRTVSLAGSVVAASGPGIVRLELTATQSASITPGRHLFQIVATQADADVATLVEASWVSRKRAAV